jgi:hypothetical protein
MNSKNIITIPVTVEIKHENLFLRIRNIDAINALPPTITARASPGIKKVLKMEPSSWVKGGVLNPVKSAIPPRKLDRERKAVKTIKVTYAKFLNRFIVFLFVC